MKRWIALLLAGILLFSAATAEMPAAPGKKTEAAETEETAGPDDLDGLEDPEGSDRRNL